MSSTSIIANQTNGVLEVQINRPDKMNALTDAMYAELRAQLAKAQQSDAIKVLVIRSSDKHFSAGNDLADFLETEFSLESNVVRFLIELASFPKPVVAAINGASVGIGLTMLLHCDIVFAAKDVKLSVPFVKLGLTPEGGSSQLLAQRCGDLKTNEWLLTGRTILADEAVDTGLVNQVFDDVDSLWAHSNDLAHKMAKNSLEVLLASKQLLKGEQLPAVVKLIEKEATVFGQRLKSEEAKAAFNAFLNK